MVVLGYVRHGGEGRLIVMASERVLFALEVASCHASGMAKLLKDWGPLLALAALLWGWASGFEDRINRRLDRIERAQVAQGERLAAQSERLAAQGERITHIEGLLRAAAQR